MNGRLWTLICLWFYWGLVSCAPGSLPHSRLDMAKNIFLANEDALNRYCLAASYPEIIASQKNGFILRNGQFLPYGQASESGGYSIRQAMRLAYPLEPERPDVPAGESPGRERPYVLFGALYGDSEAVIRRNLCSAAYRGTSVSLAPEAAAAFGRAAPRLRQLEAARPEYGKLLRPDGGFCWRRIVGENVPSAHAYGIALDLGASHAPYWRWHRQRPHPMQKTYPAEIVEIMENEGFIWGGKWHEYDLMHYEYRPELVCKARMLRLLDQQKSGK